jgi:hypothetical protein
MPHRRAACLGGLQVDVDADRALDAAVGVERDLAGDVDQVSRLDEGHIVGDRRDRLRQHDSQLLQTLFDLRHHALQQLGRMLSAAG